jgi:hypothetical protein
MVVTALHVAVIIHVHAAVNATPAVITVACAIIINVTLAVTRVINTVLTAVTIPARVAIAGTVILLIASAVAGMVVRITVITATATAAAAAAIITTTIIRGVTFCAAFAHILGAATITAYPVVSAITLIRGTLVTKIITACDDWWVRPALVLTVAEVLVGAVVHLVGCWHLHGARLANREAFLGLLVGIKINATAGVSGIMVLAVQVDGVAAGFTKSLVT